MPQANKVVFAHLRRHHFWGDVNPFGGATLAIKDDADGAHIGIAVCCKTDRYVKKAGRVRAEGRLHSVSTDPAVAKFRITIPGTTQDEVMGLLYDGSGAPNPILDIIDTALRKAGAKF